MSEWPQQQPSRPESQNWLSVFLKPPDRFLKITLRHYLLSEWGHEACTEHTWGTEDNLQKLILTFFRVGSVDQTQVVSELYPWAISLAPIFQTKWVYWHFLCQSLYLDVRMFHFKERCMAVYSRIVELFKLIHFVYKNLIKPMFLLDKKE